MRQILLVDLLYTWSSQYVTKALLLEIFQSKRVNANHKFFLVVDGKMEEIQITSVDDVEEVWCSLIDGLPSGTLLEA